MRKLTLTILLVVAVAATWAQKPDRKTVKLEKRLVGTFVEIPGSHFLTRNAKGDTMRVTLAPFRMLETEVTNASYNLFLDDLKAQGRMADYEKAKIDTSLGMLDYPYYYNHPAFGPYPVSSISYDGATLFCQWLTEKMGGEVWEYTLPTEQQWKYAARSGYPFRVYSMGSPYFRDKNGYPYYTYYQIGDPNITMRDGQFVVVTDDNPFINRGYTYMAKGHYPNDFGLYNVCGNVAEMVAERGIAYGGSYLDPGYDIRIDSEKPYNGPSPLIGFRVIAVRKK